MKYSFPFIVAIFCTFLSIPGFADDRSLNRIKYFDLKKLLPHAIDFESEPVAINKNQYVSEILSIRCASFAEAFAGQSVLIRGQHEIVEGIPDGPLSLSSPNSEFKSNLVRQSSDVWFSEGLTGLGPRNRRHGSGAISILFSIDQYALGFRYTVAPERSTDERGDITIRFFDRDGNLIGTETVEIRNGGWIAYERSRYISDIAGITIVNTDANGIMIDDLLLNCAPLIG